MSETEIKQEINRRKAEFRRQQAALPFVEKVRIAFALSRRREVFKRAKLVEDSPTIILEKTK